MKRYFLYFAHGFFFAMGVMAATIPISILLLVTGILKPGPFGTVSWNRDLGNADERRSKYQIENDAKSKLEISDLKLLKKESRYSKLFGTINNPTDVSIRFYSFTLLFYKNNELVGSEDCTISDEIAPNQSQKFSDNIESTLIPDYDRLDVLSR